MRIKASGTYLTVAELRDLLDQAGTRDDADVSFADFGAVVTAEAGPFSLELEAEEEPIDKEELFGEMLDLLESIAEGTAKGPKALAEIRKSAADLVGKAGD